MAKKLTAAQRKARKRASYYKSEYKKTVEAIQYIQRFSMGMDMPIVKEPKKITKASLKSIRKIYKETRRKIERVFDEYEFTDEVTGLVYEKLPTKAEAVKEFRAEQKEGFMPFNPYEQYIEELKEKIQTLTPLRDSDKTENNYQKNVVPKQEKIKTNFMQAIDEAIGKYGIEYVSEKLSKSSYMQKIGNLEEKYTYEIIEDMTDGDEGLLVLMDASVNAALLDRESYNP